MTEPVIRLPHFVGIGAPRCGTTWVFKMLRLHPEVWIPWKEVHYFDSIDPETRSGYDIQDRRERFRRGWHYVARRLAMRSVPGAQALARRLWPLSAIQAPGYGWGARYLLGRATPAWYESLYREGAARGLRCGEITPAYFMLSAAGIARLARMLPEARVFLLLRDPLEWAWSTLCKDVREAGGDPALLADDALIARCPVPTGHSRADFGSNLRRWLENFPRNRLLIGFYEEVQGDPLGLLDRICAHIGVAAPAAPIRRLASAKVNSSARGLPMPPAVERYAARRYLAEADTMASLIGGPAGQWLLRIRGVLENC